MNMVCFCFLPAAFAMAAEGAPLGEPLSVERSGTELLLVLTGLAIFWIFAGGLFTVLAMKAKEADRQAGLNRAGYSPRRHR